MSGAVIGIEPKILQWARKQAGYSVEQVGVHFKKDPSIIGDWETGRDSPTYPQLEKLAAFYKSHLC